MNSDDDRTAALVSRAASPPSDVPEVPEAPGSPDAAWTRHFDPQYQRHYYAHPVFGSRWDSEHELALAASASTSPTMPVSGADPAKMYLQYSHLQQQSQQQMHPSFSSGPHMIEMYASPQPHSMEMKMEASPVEDGEGDGNLLGRDSTAKGTYEYSNADEDRAYYARLPAGSRRVSYISDGSARSESFRVIGPAPVPGALPSSATVFASSGLKKDSSQADVFVPGDDIGATKSGVNGAVYAAVPALDASAQGFKQDVRGYGTNGPYDSKYTGAELGAVGGGSGGIQPVVSPRETPAVYSKGRRYCCCFRTRRGCCATIWAILIIILAGIGVALYFLWPRLPSVTIGQPYENSSLATPAVVNGSLTSASTEIPFSVQLNLFSDVSVYSPNYETLATRSIVVSGKLLNGKGGNEVNGVTINGETDGVSFQGQGTTNFTLPVSLKYAATSVSAIASDGAVTLLESECGSGGGGVLYVSYTVTIDVVLISWTGYKPSVTGTTQFNCPAISSL
ncbi:hypothetical protein HDU84_008706 [Entophlyctis sp. JEL0112]|nr:hypothetical protein HDU84_008706 [Entophlyctis sp. JEL0112]